MAQRRQDFLARHRREDSHRQSSRARLLDRSHAFLLVLEEGLHFDLAAHAASFSESRNACLSQAVPSLTSVIETIGRKRENSVNHIKNQAKLPAVIAISTGRGR